MLEVIKGFKRPFLVTIFFLLLCGLGYPLLLTGLSQLIFPVQANGSIIKVNGTAVGSKFVGQDFSDPRFMKGRPSAVDYNTYTQEQKDDGTYSGVSSGSKNYSATNPELAERVENDMNTFLAANPTIAKEDIPTDLLTASGSGLDPQISPAAAAVQIPALAQNTGLTEDVLKDIVAHNTQDRFLGVFGEPTVNVLGVNLQIGQILGIFDGQD
ncbi:K(+)-transporting ATPase subunit C [Pectinatus frisingensis]|uniref:K(+)-transporting ATPase subunit C n=1 Tax=Pectinatus frisingensis TaxID=865 RepID=UPI0015F5ABB2|nr:K(+)-transporting ATPase subunit C [Pectinatus frisingensis]